MTPSEIRERVNGLPKDIIRIFVSDGQTFDVMDPIDISFVQRQLCIGLEPDDDGIPTRAVYVDPWHVTAIEVLASDKRREAADA
ncbi:MAG: hypothetical protein AAF743_17485 [Planctomycetota bacterium]